MNAARDQVEHGDTAELALPYVRRIDPLVYSDGSPIGYYIEPTGDFGLPSRKTSSAELKER